MPNPNTLDEATAATEEMFENSEQLSLSDVPPAENTPSEDEQGTKNPPAEEVQSEAQTAEEGTVGQDPMGQSLEDAVQTAEAAAQVAQDRDNQLNDAMAEIEALRQQNQQLQGTIDEMSRQNTEEIIEEALTPPTLDINGLAFATEEEQRAAMTKYADEMSAYNRKQLLKELSPALEFAKRGMSEAEKNDAISVLSEIPDLSNIRELKPQLDRIIANNKWLQSEDMPWDMKYINAYFLGKGIDVTNNPPTVPEPAKEPTPEELLKLYNDNPAFQELVEKQRLDTIKQSQQVPPMSSSNGAVNAALNIKDKPKTLEEASQRTFEDFSSSFK